MNFVNEHDVRCRTFEKDDQYHENNDHFPTENRFKSLRFSLRIEDKNILLFDFLKMKFSVWNFVDVENSSFHHRPVVDSSNPLSRTIN